MPNVSSAIAGAQQPVLAVHSMPPPAPPSPEADNQVQWHTLLSRNGYAVQVKLDSWNKLDPAGQQHFESLGCQIGAWLDHRLVTSPLAAQAPASGVENRLDTTLKTVYAGKGKRLSITFDGALWKRLINRGDDGQTSRGIRAFITRSFKARGLEKSFTQFIKGHAQQALDFLQHPNAAAQDRKSNAEGPQEPSQSRSMNTSQDQPSTPSGLRPVSGTLSPSLSDTGELSKNSPPDGAEPPAGSTPLSAHDVPQSQSGNVEGSAVLHSGPDQPINQELAERKHR